MASGWMDGAGVAQLGAVLLQEIADQLGDVFPAIAQRRQRDDHDAQPVVEVFPELLLPDGRFEVAVGGGHDAHVHGDGLLAAEPLQALLLQHPHQLDLRAKSHVADFIQEDGAAVGLLEPADAPRLRAGEGAAFVAEQFALQQRFGNGGAVDRDERRVGPIAVLVKGAGDQLLAGAGLAADEHVDRLGGDAANLLVDGLHGGAAADQGVARGAGFAQEDRFGHEAVAVGRFADQIQQLRHIERLEHVIVSAEFRRLDGGLGRCRRP